MIERARAAEIALSIQQHKDLGCQATKVIEIDEEKSNSARTQVRTFWKLLEANADSVNGKYFD